MITGAICIVSEHGVVAGHLFSGGIDCGLGVQPLNGLAVDICLVKVHGLHCFRLALVELVVHDFLLEYLVDVDALVFDGYQQPDQLVFLVVVLFDLLLEFGGVVFEGGVFLGDILVIQVIAVRFRLRGALHLILVRRAFGRGRACVELLIFLLLFLGKRQLDLYLVALVDRRLQLAPQALVLLVYLKQLVHFLALPAPDGFQALLDQLQRTREAGVQHYNFLEKPLDRLVIEGVILMLLQVRNQLLAHDGVVAWQKLHLLAAGRAVFALSWLELPLVAVSGHVQQIQIAG